MDMDDDFRLRLAAMNALAALTKRAGGLVDASELDAGFGFDGQRVPFWNRRRGIWRPAQLGRNGAALSIMTAPRVHGRKPAYDDEVAADTKGWFGYKYEGDDPTLWTNVAVRRAMELARPLIYFYGITRGVYEPIFPVYVTKDDPAALTFRLEADVTPEVAEPQSGSIEKLATRREYQTVAVKRRLHQRRFRELVLGAYSGRCTICRLAHPPLLDAAHIIPDHEDKGLPEVSNGLSLCKIHHSAYDGGILGISADLIVHLREDILQEVDGPMLEHGLKAMEGQKISVPRSALLRPNPEFLALRFERFQAA